MAESPMASELENLIEVTDEMIEAGARADSLYDSGDPTEWRLASIYQAMEYVRGVADGRCIPIGIFNGHCLFRKNALAEVQALWDDLLAQGKLLHLPRYEWNEKKFCIEQILEGK